MATQHRRRPPVAVAVILISAAALLAMPETATGHYTEERWQRWAYRGPQFCVDTLNVQNHGYHFMQTMILGVDKNCDRGIGYVPPNNIVHLKEHYKTRVWGTAGIFCFKEGWFYNGVRDWKLVEDRPYDIWPWCNFGSGVHTWITMDTFQYGHPQNPWAHDPNHYWFGNQFKPATKHCHCP